MTVEAALVFPFFLFALTALLYLLVLLRLKTEVGRGLTDTGRELSCLAYHAKGAEASLAVGISGKQHVKEYLKEKGVSGIIKGGTDGISLIGSSFRPEDSMITLKATYQVILPPGLGWFHPIRITQIKRVRGWTGFEERGKHSGDAGEEIVYVTDYGTVYHLKLSCRHLKLSIQQKNLSELEGLRNEHGAKYYPCERCWKNGSAVVYVTADGTRCHESLNCSGLVRGIHTVLISETGGMPPCSVCGG